MNYIFSVDAFDLMEFLKDIPLQIHDIPYQVSVKNDEIDLKGRTPMIRNFGDWDVLPDLEKFANLCGFTMSFRALGMLLILILGCFVLKNIKKELKEKKRKKLLLQL